jgi:uncharacterized protein
VELEAGSGATGASLEVRQLDDPVEFLDEAEQLLLRDEARHNLMLGLAATLRDEPDRYPDFGLWLVEDRGEVVGVALRTRPHHPVLARPRDHGVLEPLAGAIGEELPGVVGAVPEAEQFAKVWAERTSVGTDRRFGMGLYALEQVRPVTGVPGTMRPAAAGDRPLVLEWWRAFAIEAMHEEDPDPVRIERDVDYRLTSERSGLLLWDDGGVVSLAGFGGETPNGIRVGPVYTPPELRGRGYASALVARLSAQQLAAGRRFCFLYTDQENPTSNRIYRRIGYELVCESVEIGFVAREKPA